MNTTDILNRIIKETGRTDVFIAKQLSMSPQQLGAYRKGLVTPSADKLIEMVQKLGWDIIIFKQDTVINT